MPPKKLSSILKYESQIQIINNAINGNTVKPVSIVKPKFSIFIHSYTSQ